MIKNIRIIYLIFRRVVSTEDGEIYANSINIDFYEISALKDQNIENIFIECIKKINDFSV